MKNKALGMLEVQGFSVAMYAMNMACKSVEIEIIGIDCNNPVQGENATIPVVVQVKFIGRVDDVKEGIEIARENAKKFLADEDIFTHCISSYSNEIEAILKQGKVKVK